MMIKAFILLLTTIFFHPVHLSMSSLTLLPDESGFELVLRVNSNDLAVDIWRLYQPDEDFFEDHSFIGPEHFYYNFVNDNVVVRINSKPVKGEPISIEKQETETIIKLFIPLKRKIKSLDVENNLFTVLSPDQVNLFIFKSGEIEKSFRFTLMSNSFSMIE